ncbi:hypothetical protein FB451DRAFT_716208 [Mycena latifolia]|nr:hypothetical protein FB451DRAFT_716208 [Mycena latifolia]
MPIFSSCTGFHIHDGTFYEVSGDVNLLPTHQQLVIGDGHRAHAGVYWTQAGPATGSTVPQLQDGWTEGSREPSSGAARSVRRMAAPVVPYDAFRPRLLLRGSSDFEATSNAITLLSGGSNVDRVIQSIPDGNQPSVSSSISLPSISSWFPSSNHPLDYQHSEPRADRHNFATEPHQNYPMFHPQDGPFHYSLPHVEPSPDIHDSQTNNLAPYADRVQADPGPSIHGGTFITAQNVNNDYRRGKIGIDILHRGVALEALHDSADSFPQPKCHPETREKMLDDLWEYATGTEPRDKILWLYGPAGAGKSAIMWSLCERLEDAGRLGGTFFFKRAHPTRGNARALFSTIAYRLALRVPWLKGPISEAVENDPSLVGSTPEIQLQKLILGPCSSPGNHDPEIIIIDGLDECEGHQMQQDILRILGKCVPLNHRSLRILIASRPEAHITEMISISGGYEALDVEQSFADVQKYLLDEFSKIHQAHQRTMEHIPRPWPSEDEVETLVRRSSGHFIYATTIIKFIDDPNFRPTERLAAVVRNHTKADLD